MAEARGAPMRWRCGCGTMMPGFTLRTLPPTPKRAAVFDALETARVEALGARSMDGVRANLAELAEARVRGDAIVRARTVEEVPLATAIGLIARAAADRGEAPPRRRAPGSTLVARMDRGQGRRPTWMRSR